jgi:hypothetical protein
MLRLAFGNLSTVALQAKLATTFPEALRLLESGSPWVELA